MARELCVREDNFEVWEGIDAGREGLALCFEQQKATQATRTSNPNTPTHAAPSAAARARKTLPLSSFRLFLAAFRMSRIARSYRAFAFMRAFRRFEIPLLAPPVVDDDAAPPDAKRRSASDV